MLGYGMRYNKMVRSISMLGSKIPTEIDERLVVLALGIERFYSELIMYDIYLFGRGFPFLLHVLVLMPCSRKFSNTCCTNIQLVAIICDYSFYIIAHFACLIEHIEHNACIE